MTPAPGWAGAEEGESWVLAWAPFCPGRSEERQPELPGLSVHFSSGLLVSPGPKLSAWVKGGSNSRPVQGLGCLARRGGVAASPARAPRPLVHPRWNVSVSAEPTPALTLPLSLSILIS